MKILVSIANYGNNQIHLLYKMINEFNLFNKNKYKIDIIIHSNISLNIPNVTTILHTLNDFRDLPWKARESIYRNRNHYDLFIYSENDHLITQQHIESFLNITSHLPSKYIIGFLRYEFKSEWGQKFFPDYRPCWKWERAFKVYRYKFAHYTNIHQGCFILKKEQLHSILNNWGGNFTKNQNFGIADPLVQACTDVYGKHSGFIKVIPISHFDQFIIHHLSNKYGEENIKSKARKNQITYTGTWENIVQDQIRRLGSRIK